MSATSTVLKENFTVFGTISNTQYTYSFDMEEKVTWINENTLDLFEMLEMFYTSVVQYGSPRSPEKIKHLKHDLKIGEFNF